MTKELEQKIYRMLKSTDREMVFLGIQLLLNSTTEHECMKMIPWNSLRHFITVNHTYINSIIRGHTLDYKLIISKEIVKQWTREPFELNILGHYEWQISEIYPIWIKGNIAITCLSGSLVCRRLGLMKCLVGFENRPKIVYG